MMVTKFQVMAEMRTVMLNLAINAVEEFTLNWTLLAHLILDIFTVEMAFCTVQRNEMMAMKTLEMDDLLHENLNQNINELEKTIQLLMYDYLFVEMARK